MDVEPIILCIPNKGSEEYISGTSLWNFASECRSVGAIDITPTLQSIDVSSIKRNGTGFRQCWLRLSIAVSVDIAITVSWRRDGSRVKKGEADLSSAKLTIDLDMSQGALVNEFRTPIQQRESSGSNISHDTLPQHLQALGALSDTSADSGSSRSKDREMTVGLSTRLGKAPSPSSYSSSASVSESGFSGRKRRLSEANSGGDDFSMAPQVSVPRSSSHWPPSHYNQPDFILPSPLAPDIPPTQARVANHLPRLLPVTAPYPGPSPMPVTSLTGSQFTADVFAIAPARLQLGPDQFYPPPAQVFNQLSGFEHHLYPVPGTQYPVSTAGVNSNDPAFVNWSPHGMQYSNYNSVHTSREEIPPSMVQWPHKQVSHSFDREDVKGRRVQALPGAYENMMVGSSVWPSTGGGSS